MRIVLLLCFIFSFLTVSGQKVLYSSEDSIILIDVTRNLTFNLLPKDNKLCWIDGKFAFDNNICVLFRYNYCKTNTIVKEFKFDTLTYTLIDQIEYTTLGHQEDKYNYNYQHPNSNFIFYGNIFMKQDTGLVVFKPSIDMGKTQIKYYNGFEIHNNKLICERWHVKHHSDKLSVEPVQIIEIDISTKQMTPLINGWFPSLSKDERYILYTCYGECTERFGIYDLQNRELVFMFDGIYARWVQ